MRPLRGAQPRRLAKQLRGEQHTLVREQGHDDVERDEGDIADAWLFYDDMVAERKANGRETEGRYRQNFQTNRQNFETDLASGGSYSLASSHADVEEFISQKWRPSEVSAGRVDVLT